MGFEYKIIARFTSEQVAEIRQLFTCKNDFDKKYTFEDKLFWEFREVDNNNKMPNYCISIEQDGIYVCRYDTMDLWENLQELKDYIDGVGIQYIVLDYQE